jgi:hypothetical protein
MRVPGYSERLKSVNDSHVIAVERCAPYPTHASSDDRVADYGTEICPLAHAYTTVFQSLTTDCACRGICIAGTIQECDERGENRTDFKPFPARSPHIFGRWPGPR